MKAYIISKYSKTDPLQLVNVSIPDIGPHEVLIAIHAAGINQLDVKLKAGEFKLLLPYKLPLVLGHDVAGIISGVGAEVKKFKVGDEVFARPADFKIGTFAEFIAIDENDIA
ncbi:MAG: NADP-dependent oxidoreductase, partial [Sphingobacteriales bacterium]